jgi:hypothetical protein
LLGEVPAPLFLMVFSILVFLYWEQPSRKAPRRWFAKDKARLAPLPALPSASPVGH